MKLEQVYPIRDNDGHWFVIPFKSVNEFNGDLEDCELCDSGEFDNKWGMYRLGGSLSLFDFYGDLGNL